MAAGQRFTAGRRAGKRRKDGRKNTDFLLYLRMRLSFIPKRIRCRLHRYGKPFAFCGGTQRVLAGHSVILENRLRPLPQRRVSFSGSRMKMEGCCWKPLRCLICRAFIFKGKHRSYRGRERVYCNFSARSTGMMTTCRISGIRLLIRNASAGR